MCIDSEIIHVMIPPGRVGDCSTMEIVQAALPAAATRETPIVRGPSHRANGVAHATNDQTQCFDAPSYTSHMCKLPLCDAAFLCMPQAGELSLAAGVLHKAILVSTEDDSRCTMQHMRKRVG